MFMMACKSLLGILQGFLIWQDSRCPCPITFQKTNVTFILTYNNKWDCIIDKYDPINKPAILWYPKKFILKCVAMRTLL